MQKFRNHFTNPGNVLIRDWFRTYDDQSQAEIVQRYYEPVLTSKFVCYIMVDPDRSGNLVPYGSLLPTRIKSVKIESTQPKRRVEPFGASSGYGNPSQLLVMENGLQHQNVNLTLEENVDGTIYRSLMALYNAQNFGDSTSLPVMHNSNWDLKINASNNIILNVNIVIVQYKGYSDKSSGRSMLVPFRKIILDKCVLTGINNQSAGLNQSTSDIIRYDVTLNPQSIKRYDSEMSLAAINEALEKAVTLENARLEQIGDIDSIKEQLSGQIQSLENLVAADTINDKLRTELKSQLTVVSVDGKKSEIVDISKFTKDPSVDLIADQETFIQNNISPLKEQLNKLSEIRNSISDGDILSAEQMKSIETASSSFLSQTQGTIEKIANSSYGIKGKLEYELNGELKTDSNGNLYLQRIAMEESIKESSESATGISKRNLISTAVSKFGNSEYDKDKADRKLDGSYKYADCSLLVQGIIKSVDPSKLKSSTAATTIDLVNNPKSVFNDITTSKVLSSNNDIRSALSKQAIDSYSNGTVIAYRYTNNLGKQVGHTYLIASDTDGKKYALEMSGAAIRDGKGKQVGDKDFVKTDAATKARQTSGYLSQQKNVTLRVIQFKD